MTDESTPKDGMNPEEIGEVYRKLATPGESHALLASMAGSWRTSTRSYMAPGAPPVASEGSCEQRMILGGRYLHQEFKGDMMGTPFTGIGVTGFDNHTRKFVSTWMDSMGTGIYYFEGTLDADGRTMTQECRCDDPIKGPMTLRSVTRILDEDTHEFEIYGTDRSGKEEKMMEMTYKRKR